MTPTETLAELRRVEEKHKGEFTSTFHINISDMARDAANAIEELLSIINSEPTLPDKIVDGCLNVSKSMGIDLASGTDFSNYAPSFSERKMEYFEPTGFAQTEKGIKEDNTHASN